MGNNMTFEEWIEKFKPVTNTLVTDAPYNGCMFETYGKELEMVLATKKENPFKIWTVLDSGDICQGTHIVNRLGYFICEVPWTEGEPDIVMDLTHVINLEDSDEENRYSIYLNDEEVVVLPESISESKGYYITEAIDDFVFQNDADLGNSKISIKESSDEPALGIIVDIFNLNDELIDTTTIWYEDYL